MSQVIKLTLRLWGEGLDPEVVTKSIGFEPTQSYPRGTIKRLSSGKYTSPKEIGMWAVEKTISKSFEVDLSEFLSDVTAIKFASIPGVKIAILDIYLGLSDEASIMTNSYEYRIDHNSLLALSEMGVDVRVTVT